VQWWLQPAGPDSVHLLEESPEAEQLAYTLPEFDIRMPFKPTDFTQVNPQINRVLVGRALRLLAPQAHERVIDWFCGLGNFTLPLARLAGQVHGIEGSAALLERALANAALHGLRERVSFEARNLFDLDAAALVSRGRADRWLARVAGCELQPVGLEQPRAKLHAADRWSDNCGGVYGRDGGGALQSVRRSAGHQSRRRDVLR
jgi:23S rRNA (uracil1939-C5)-methyltransferase